MNFKKISFKRKSILYNIVILFIFLCSMLSFLFVNSNMYEKHVASIRDYTTLDDFYTKLDLAQASFKSYLYTYQEKDYDAFVAHLENAQQDLAYFIDKTQYDNAWRFVLLENMLHGYTQQVNKAKEVQTLPPDTFQNIYNDLLTTYNMTKDTTGFYYQIITTKLAQDQHQLEQTQQYLRIASTALSILFSLWLIFVTSMMVRSLTKPLSNITKNVHRIKQGEYDLKDVSDTSSEMEILCLALKDMANTIQKNIETDKEKALLETKLLEQENMNLKMNEVLVQSELKLLQNQINPHFLFNTLNMIHKTAYFEHASKTSELMEKTSALLRYGIDKTNKMSDLFAEIESLRNYIYIQENRYDDRISFCLDIDESLTNFKLPGMILQPLVENAIKHGLKDTMEHGMININIYEKANEVYLCISDNGVGMNTNALEDMIIREFKSDATSSSLGLYNVTKRISMFFGDHATISFNSCEDCGFEVIIKIKLEGMDEHVHSINRGR